MKTSHVLMTLFEQLCVCLAFFLTAGLFAKPILAISCNMGLTNGSISLLPNKTCSIADQQGAYGGTTTTTNTGTVTLGANDIITLTGLLIGGTITMPSSVSIWIGGTISTKQLCGLDADSDGYPANTTWTAGCGTGYRPLEALTSLVSIDCDDGNAGVHSSTTCYTDVDGDTWTVGSGQSYCGGCPGGTTAIQKGTDCNDNNAGVHANITCYTDVDGDHYTVGNGNSYCATSCPGGTTGTQLQWGGADDCNDADIAHYYVDIYGHCTLP